MAANFLSRFFKGKTFPASTPSGSQAKKRLQLALLYDKLDISDEMIQRLQKDLVDVLSRYFEIDHGSMRLEITREDEGMSALMMNTPLLSAKRLESTPAMGTRGDADSKVYEENGTSGVHKKPGASATGSDLREKARKKKKK